MSDRLFDLFSDNPTLITHCPICNGRYDPLEARLMEEAETSHLVYIKCHYCKSAVLTLIVSNNMGLTSIGLLTDLSDDDVRKFREEKPISANQVLEFHEQLSTIKVPTDFLN